jgi:hypothetical protein
MERSLAGRREAVDEHRRPIDHVHVLRVGRAARRLAGPVTGLGILWLCFGHLLGPLDLRTFLHAGREVLAGTTPYVSVTSSTFTSGHAFVYPSFVAWLFAPLALVPASLAVLLYTALSVAAIFMAARWFDRGDMYAPMLILVSSTTIVGLQMGTVNPILLLGVAAAWRWRMDRPIVSGIALGAMAGVKLFLAPLLLWPLLRRRYSSAVAAAVTFSMLLAPQAALGHAGISRYFAMLSELQRAEAGHSWSVASFVQHLGIGGQMSAELAIVFGAACLVVLGLSKNRLSDRQLLGLTVVVCLIISPIVWSSYLLLLAIPLLLLSKGDAPLAVAALASWVIVTPDQASGPRVAVGVGLAAVVSYLSIRPKVGYLTRRWIGVTSVAVGGGLLWILLPASVRSPMPTLAAMAVLAAWALCQSGPARLSMSVANSPTGFVLSEGKGHPHTPG